MKNEITNLLREEIEKADSGAFFDFEEDLKFRSPNRNENKQRSRKMSHKVPEISLE